MCTCVVLSREGGSWSGVPLITAGIRNEPGFCLSAATKVRYDHALMAIYLSGCT